jgi:hypothetical protein
MSTTRPRHPSVDDISAATVHGFQRDVAQKGAPDLRGLDEVRRWSAQDGPAGFQDVAAVGEPQRQLHVLLDEDDGDALLVPDVGSDRGQVSQSNISRRAPTVASGYPPRSDVTL